MDDKYAFRMGLNSKHFECLVHHIYIHIKATELKLYQQHSTWVRITWYPPLFDLVISVLLRELRTVHPDCVYFTPPLTAAAYSHLHFRRGASQTSLISVIALVHYWATMRNLARSFIFYICLTVDIVCIIISKVYYEVLYHCISSLRHVTGRWGILECDVRGTPVLQHSVTQAMIQSYRN